MSEFQWNLKMWNSSQIIKIGLNEKWLVTIKCHEMNTLSISLRWIIKSHSQILDILRGKDCMTTNKKGTRSRMCNLFAKIKKMKSIGIHSRWKTYA